MGVIRVHADPFGGAPPAVHAWDGPYIDWVQAQYPDGFGRPHQSRLDGKTLAVADYDVVLESGAQVDLLLYPAEPISAALAGISLVKVLVGLAVSIAVNYAANALFGAKPQQIWRGTTRTSNTPEPGSVYGINAPRNEARIGQPVECQYGRVRSAPALATSPYTWYDNNTQYLAVILRIGHGDHVVHELYASDSAASQLKPGTLTYWPLGPSWHGSEWGRIQNALGIYEDVDTSVEVSDIELAPAATFSQRAVINYEASTLYFSSPLPADAVVGAQVRIWLQTWWFTTFTIASIAADRLSLTTVQSLDGYGDSGVTLYETRDVTTRRGTTWLQTRVEYGSQTDLSPWVGASLTVTLADAGEASQTLSGTVLEAGPGYFVIDDALPWPMFLLTNDWDSVSGQIVSQTTVYVDVVLNGSLAGPFVVCAEERVTRLVAFDLVWPYGLYTVNEEDGTLLPATVWLSLYLEEIDDAGNPTGGLGYSQSYSYTAQTNTPQRKTVWMACGGKRYRASVQRTNPGTGKAQDMFRTYWTGLKAVLEHWGEAAYGEVTLIAMQVRATEGLSTDAAQRITVDCTRVLEGAATSNPAAAVRDAWTNTVYGAGRSLAELDAAALAAVEAAGVGHNGYNARLTGQRSVWDTLRAIVRPLDFYPVPLGGLVSFARDAATDVDTMYFRGAEDARGPANMLDVSVSMTWDEPGDPDGFEVEYITATRGMPDYVVYPTDAADPETVQLEGCTDTAVATAFCRGLWSRKRYRREWLRWDCELEGEVVPIGARVAVSHRLVGTDVPYIVQSVRPGEDKRHTISAWRYDARQYG